MIRSDSFVFAVRALARHKLRTTLTMLGMIIGVAAVMTMVALGNGAQAVGRRRADLGRDEPRLHLGRQLHARRRSTSRWRPVSARRERLVHDDGVAIAAEVSGIKQWSAGISDRAPMAAGDRRYFGRIIGAMPSFAAIHSWTLGQGAMFEDRARRRQGGGRGDRHRRRGRAVRRPAAGRTHVPHPEPDVHGRRRDRQHDRGSCGRRCSCRTPRCRRCAAARISTRITIAAERAGRPRGSPIRQQPFSACATGSARATAGRRRCARRLHHQDRSRESADQGAVHVGGRLRAGQPAAARQDHARRDDGHAPADQQHADGAAREHRGDLARRRRHRDHEHHARLRHRADARDRPADGRGRPRPRRADPVPGRGRARSASPAASSASRSATSPPASRRGSSTGGPWSRPAASRSPWARRSGSGFSSASIRQGARRGSIRSTR